MRKKFPTEIIEGGTVTTSGNTKLIKCPNCGVEFDEYI